jgi:hypothetical protein
MREQVDAHARRGQLGNGLEHLALDPGRVQLERERQAADAAADDGDGTFRT